MRVYLVAVGALCTSLFLPAIAAAHAFGQQYTLPLPLSFYTTGAGAAVLASFVILSFLDVAPKRRESVYQARWLAAWATTLTARTAGVFFLFVAIVVGFWGPQDAFKNMSPFLFWIGLMLIMTYASALVAGVWHRFDPFRTLVAPVYGRHYQAIFLFPKWLRYIPPTIFFAFLVWFELLSHGAGAIPGNIAMLLVFYLALTYFGAGLFGVGAWFCWGDFFSVFFGVIERFAPFQLRIGKIRVMPPGERLIKESAESSMLLIFILAILSTTSFDGLQDTKPWMQFFSAYPAFEVHYDLVSIFILLLSPFFFLSLYACAIALMRVVVGHGSVRALLMRFAFSLVPIAIAYNVAHYFSLVISEGQNLIPMLSDPFGTGANFFGTANYVYNTGLLSATAVWYTQVGAIVVGHIAATYVAHRIAVQEFSSRRAVIAGQLPMVALMVMYTAFGLWILSLPYSN